MVEVDLRCETIAPKSHRCTTNYANFSLQQNHKSAHVFAFTTRIPARIPSIARCNADPSSSLFLTTKCTAPLPDISHRPGYIRSKTSCTGVRPGSTARDACVRLLYIFKEPAVRDISLSCNSSCALTAANPLGCAPSGKADAFNALYTAGVAQWSGGRTKRRGTSGHFSEPGRRSTISPRPEHRHQPPYKK